MELYTIEQLKGELQQRGLDTSGTKADLEIRLQEAIRLQADSQGGHDQDNLQTEDDGVRPEDSASRVQGSNVSKASGSTLIRQMALEAANQQALILKVQNLEAVQRIEEEEHRLKNLKVQSERELQRLQQEKQRLELENEIKQAEARSQVLAAHIERGSSILSKKSLSQYTIPHLSYVAPVYSPIASRMPALEGAGKEDDQRRVLSVRPKDYQVYNNSPNQHVPTTKAEHNVNPSPGNMMDTLVTYNLKNLLPKFEVEKFSGDITKYRSFIRAFDSAISDKITSDEERYLFLDQHTAGEAKELIRSCDTMPASEGYNEARRLLHEAFGQDEVIVTAHIEKVLEWPNLKEHDSQGFHKFYVMLLTCLNALRGDTEGIKAIEHSTTMKQIVQKLPYSMQEKWCSKAVEITDKTNKFPTYKDLVDFVGWQSKRMKHPVYGKLLSSRAPKGDSIKAQPKSQKTEKSKTPAREQNKGKPVHSTRVGQLSSPKPSCQYCSKDHWLDNCETLRAKPIEERQEFVQQNSLCFGCLRPGHPIRNCLKRRTCQTCFYKHPTILHKDHFTSTRARPVQTVSESAESTTKQSDEVKDVKVSFSKLLDRNELCDAKLTVIPVKVRDNAGQLIPTLAFLDSGSAASFCSEDLFKKLKCQSPTPAQFSMTTADKEGIRKKGFMLAGLEVCDPDENNFIPLPPVFTLDKIRVDKDEVITQEDIQQWPHLQGIDITTLDSEVGLLIGNNVPEAAEPWEIIHGPQGGDPFACKTRLGWIVSGYPRREDAPHVKVSRIKVCDVTLNQILENMYNHEFSDVNSTKQALSQEDKRWESQVEESCKLTQEGHYEIGMPFRDRVPTLPNNKKSAVKRLEGLKKRFEKDDQFYEDYNQFMSNIISKGYAEEVSEDNQQKDSWFIPHHGVYHHQKTDQLRVVFDCAAKYQGTSLNDILLQGPDLANPLVEVLIKFRQHPFAFMADIKSMFYQVEVPEKDRNFLRFLWWKEGDFYTDPKEYRMKVHPFGAKSSPSCANFALHKTVKDNIEEYSSEAQHTIMNNFYVDDCLKSTVTEEELIKTAQEVKDLCSKGGFELTKFVSNSRELLTSLPVEECGNKVKEIDLSHDSLPTESALGIKWDTEVDTLTVSVKDKDKPLTRRGILSTIGAMYDPLGMVAPFLLQGRLIMQDLCRLNIGWDEIIPETHRVKWMDWRQSMLDMGSISLERCMKPEDFGTIVSCQIHHFSDASEKGYGTCTYLRLCNSHGKIHCAFLFGKAHVAPLKAVTIPRLELMAAVSAVRVNNMITRALEIPVQRVVFWTDSTTVLRYIRNETARFHIFVANRLSVIHDGSQVEQWRYVNSALNPADDASRGNQSERWLKGPDFLYQEEQAWPCEPAAMSVQQDGDLEIKSFTGLCNVSDTNPITKLMMHYSDWHKLKKAVAWLLRLRSILRKDKEKENSKFITVKELEDAERAIIRVVQEESFKEEIEKLRKCSSEDPKGKKDSTRRSCLSKKSSIIKLRPFLHKGLLRVGGRLGKTSLEFDTKYPLILPGKHHITELIVRDCHEKIGHSGREHVLCSLRERYWIVRGNKTVRKIIGDCIKCRRYQAPVVQQLMSDLPESRVCSDEPPFTNTGVDCFGPFFIKKGRTGTDKRYGVIFTCLTVRAIHIEVTESLTTDSFINALRRFIARRGQVKNIYSDRGTNFVGADKELKRAMKEWSQTYIYGTLLIKGIDWHFNPPHASHFGGAWERQIRTVRKVLNGVMREQKHLTNEGFNTLMCEVEAIINSRPLTSISDNCNDPNPLTPNHLLTFRGGPCIVGEMSARDQYCKRRWRHVQYLADLFWKRWKNTYLLTLQERQKWNVEQRNLSVGDVVLVVDNNTPRCHWPMGRVKEVKFSSDGLVRSVTIKCGNSLLDRPVSKLVLLCEHDNT